VIFDNAVDPIAQKRLLASKHIVFRRLSGSHSRFSSSCAWPKRRSTRTGPRFAFACPSRCCACNGATSSRVRPPLSKPAKCLVPYGEDGKQYESLRVLDLSAGGMAVMTHPEKFDLPLGRAIENCYPRFARCRLRQRQPHVRHVDAVPKDEKARRCGCEFVDMPPASRVMLQRYINRSTPRTARSPASSAWRRVHGPRTIQRMQRMQRG